MFGGRSDLKFNDEFLKSYPNSKADRLAFIQIKRSSVKELGTNEEYELKSSTFEALPYAFKDYTEDKNEHYYHLLGLIGAKREWKYIEKNTCRRDIQIRIILINIKFLSLKQMEVVFRRNSK